MVGSMSFSSGARISVIPCFAVQSIAAPFLGCQQKSCWNGRQTEVDSPTMVVKTLHLTSLAVSLLAARVLYCRQVYCTTDTTLSSYTVRTPPTAFLLSLSPFLMAASLYTLYHSTSYWYCRQVHCTTDTTAPSSTVSTPPMVFLLRYLRFCISFL